jgi:hypothetical protein
MPWRLFFAAHLGEASHAQSRLELAAGFDLLAVAVHPRFPLLLGV